MLKLLWVLVAYSALKLKPSTASAQGVSCTLLNSFTNPTPALRDTFGYCVAAMGSDRVLIGANADDTGDYNAGAAYLFNTDGVLLTTFTNPTPEAGDEFGCSVAAMGSDRVLIAAQGENNQVATRVGAAYLFNTNGVLVTTFTNPTPSKFEYFGRSVAAVGSSLVLIGAEMDSTGAESAGAAYLFSTNGTLITTFTNPAPAEGDAFGCSVAALGNDRVLIGAIGDDTGANEAGVVYLFGTNGALLTTFTNPTPADHDYFGRSVAAVGSSGILIGSPFDSTTMTYGGAAYLFNTNGVLVTTFTRPAFEYYFGISVTAVGTDRVLIGAYADSTVAEQAGAAYLFGTNGVLLATITNPVPIEREWFGCSVAAVGADWILIGAAGGNTGAEGAGAAYLFDAKPILKIQRALANTVSVSWSSGLPGWILQQNTNSISSVNWSNVSGVIQNNGITKTLNVNPPTGNRFYRLFKP